MERNDTNWNDLPSEIRGTILQHLDLVEDPRQIQRVRLVSKWTNNICNEDKMMLAWYQNNFSAHLPPDPVIPTIQVIFESYIDEIGAYKTNPIAENYLQEIKTKNTLYSFVLTYDLEILARKLIWQQKILTSPTEIQAIFHNEAVNCLKVFIAYGNGPNHVISMGRTLLHSGTKFFGFGCGLILYSACYFNAYECAKILLEMGANVHALENVWHQTPLHVAVQRGNRKLIELLLEYKANMLAPDKGTLKNIKRTGTNAAADLLTPLGMCALYGNLDVKQLAIEYKKAHGLE